MILLPINVNIDEVVGQLYASFKCTKYNLNTCSIKIEKIYFMGRAKYIVLYVGALVQDEIKLNDELDEIY